MIRVAVDAMGGDYAPVEMVKGAVDAVAKTDQIEIALVGKEDVVRRELEKYSYPKDRIRVIHASEVIETEEPPVNAIRKKKDSSIVVGMNMVKKQGFALEEALPYMTENVAEALGLSGKKGSISAEADADLLLIDADMNLQSVIARGVVFMNCGTIIKKGTYEK